MSELAHSTSACLHECECMCVDVFMCARRRGSLREATNQVRKLTFVEFECQALS